MSCAKTAEPIEMQSGMLSGVGPGTCITWAGDARPEQKLSDEVLAWLSVWSMV